MERLERLEGRVKSVELTKSTHSTGGLEPRHIPYLKFSIKNGSGKTRKIEMPIDIGDESNFRLIKGAMIGESVIYTKEMMTDPELIVSREIILKSGKYKGLKYSICTT